jgi:hypothetical protein
VEEEEHFQVAVELSKREHQRWEKLYRKRGFKTRPLCLGGSSCLLMPYGRQLVNPEENNKDTAARDRAYFTSIPAIKKELIKFADNGLMYEKSDLRWRHVLRDTEGEIFLCDLESLKALPKGKEKRILSGSSSKSC